MLLHIFVPFCNKLWSMCLAFGAGHYSSSLELSGKLFPWGSWCFGLFFFSLWFCFSTKVNIVPNILLILNKRLSLKWKLTLLNLCWRVIHYCLRFQGRLWTVYEIILQLFIFTDSTYMHIITKICILCWPVKGG